jgi:hypothetical protein
VIKKNILIIINSLGFGGNETAAFQLISNIDRSKFNCYILVITNNYGPMSDTLIKNGIKILNFNNSNILSFSFFYQYYNLIKK